jgi:hypothetical protein
MCLKRRMPRIMKMLPAAVKLLLRAQSSDAQQDILRRTARLQLEEAGHGRSKSARRSAAYCGERVGL